MKTKTKQILLSKTDYVTGIHCPKSLWLKFYKKNIKEPLSSSTLINIDEGNKVGELALTHSSFKNGFKITELDITKSLKETKKSLKKYNILFEPAFSYSYHNLKCFVRVDILKKNSNGKYDMIEVKSASNTTDRHLHDIAFQKMVLEKNNIIVENVFIMKPNKEYSKEDILNIESFFNLENVNHLIVDYSKQITKNLFKFDKLLTNKKEYRGYVGTKCKRPFTCPFFNYCNKSIVEDSVENLSRLSLKKKKALKKNNIKYIKDIPLTFELTKKQSIQRSVAINEKPLIDTFKIKSFLKGLKYPLYHLDFETYCKSIPPFKNTKPNQMIVFQVSLHKELSKSKIEHYEFLHTEQSDPRLKVIHFLLSNLKRSGSIIVWHKSFEISRIKELANDFPKYKNRLLKLIPRIIDLEDVFTQNMIYKSEFIGRTSIKKILPAMTKEYGYDRLYIQNGSDAQATYLQLISGKFKGNYKKKIIKELLSYCELDTFAMKIILDKVRSYI